MRTSFCLLALVPLSFAQEGPAKKDPLPPGVVAKIPVDCASSLAFVGDEELLVSGFFAHLSLWNLKTLKQTPLPGHFAKARGTFEANGSATTFVLRRSYASMNALTWPRGDLLTEVPMYAACFAISENGKFVAAANARTITRQATAEKGTHTIALDPKRDDDPLSIALSPAGDRIALGELDGTISLWDPVAKKMEKDWKAPVSEVWAIRYSPDGTLLATGHGDGAARLWDLKTGKHLHTLATGEYSLAHLAFSRDGQHLLTATFGAEACLWSVAGGKIVSRFPADFVPGGINAACVSRDMKLAAFGAKDHVYVFRLSDVKRTGS